MPRMWPWPSPANLSLSGTSSTERALNLDRHWRNIRTHSVHDANHWRYHVAGDYLLNGTLPAKPARKLRPAEPATLPA